MEVPSKACNPTEVTLSSPVIDLMPESWKQPAGIALAPEGHTNDSRLEV